MKKYILPTLLIVLVTWFAGAQLECVPSSFWCSVLQKKTASDARVALGISTNGGVTGVTIADFSNQFSTNGGVIGFIGPTTNLVNLNVLVSSNATTTAEVQMVRKDNATAGARVGSLSGYGYSDTGVRRQFGNFLVQVENPTNANESSSFRVQTFDGGSQKERIKIYGGGLFISGTNKFYQTNGAVTGYAFYCIDGVTGQGDWRPTTLTPWTSDINGAKFNLTNANNAVIGLATNTGQFSIAGSTGGIAGGIVDGANSKIKVIGDGSMAFGYATSGGIIEIFGDPGADGSGAFGVAKNNGVVSAYGPPEGAAWAWGYATGSDSIVQAAGSGCAVFGYATSGGLLNSAGYSCLVNGYATDAGSEVSGSGIGSVANGYAINGGQISSGAIGSHASGATDAGIIRADGDGSIANGSAKFGGLISALGEGSTALGMAYNFGDESGLTNAANGKASFVGGGGVVANNDYDFAFGQQLATDGGGNGSEVHGSGYTNVTTQSFSVGWGAKEFEVTPNLVTSHVPFQAIGSCTASNMFLSTTDHSDNFVEIRNNANTTLEFYSPTWGSMILGLNFDANEVEIVNANVGNSDVSGTSFVIHGGTGNAAFNNTSVSSLAGTGGTPGISAGAGAGTSPSVSIVGNNLAGEITVTTGTLPSVNAVIVTITYADSFAFSTDSYPMLWPANASASALTILPFVNGSTTGFTVNAAVSVGLAGSTTYKYNYHVIGN